MILLNPPDASIQVSRESLLVCFAAPPSNKLLNDMAKLDDSSGIMVIDRTDDDTIKYMVRLSGLYDPVEAAVMFKNALVTSGLRAEIRNIPRPGYGYGYYDSATDDTDILPDAVRTNYDYLVGTLIHKGHTDDYITGLVESLDLELEPGLNTDSYSSKSGGSKRLKDRLKKKTKRDAKMSPSVVKKNQKRQAENSFASNLLLEIEEISSEGNVVRRRVSVPVLSSARVDSSITASSVKKNQKVSAEEQLMRMLKGALKVMREARVKK